MNSRDNNFVRSRKQKEENNAKVTAEDRARFVASLGFEQELFFIKLGGVFDTKLESVRFNGKG